MDRKAMEITSPATAAIQKKHNLPPEAQRALAEAKARRTKAGKTDKQTAQSSQTAQKEIGGRKDGKEPTRFGDWEFKGRAIDF